MSPLLASLTCLFACPQILSDDFDATSAAGVAGAGICSGQSCAAGAGGSGPGGAGDGVGGASAGVGGGGSTDAGGSSSSGGTASTAGSAGTAGSRPDLDVADASAPDASDDTGLGPDCWAIVLDDTTQDTSSNCLDIQGWNDVVSDDEHSPPSVVSLSYTGGAVCFQGTIQPAAGVGWGAVYSLTFANEAVWNASSRGVGGFRLSASGTTLPAQMRVVYTATSDFCSVVTPGPDVPIPFSTAHPNCTTANPGSGVPDPATLRYLRLVIPPASTAYAIDFCLQIRAIP